MSVTQGIVDWNIERGLDKRPFDLRVETVNIFEEILEMWGCRGDSCRMLAEAFVDDAVVTMVDILKKLGDNEMYQAPTDDDIVDALSDIKVFVTGAILKRGYNPVVAEQEVLKEISSRTGTIIDGKFVKDKSDEAVARWYTADFTLAKLS